MSTALQPAVHPSSFRDPSGFMFRGEDGALYRQVNKCFADEFQHLHDSGLHEKLVSKGWLIEAETVSLEERVTEDAAFILKPRELPLLTFPYEWSFSQLKDAALLTLKIQLEALEHGMSLKDASAFNVQYDGCRPVFIDTLSLGMYEESKPWEAYGQFCRHFVAPLLLMSKVDIGLNKLMAMHIDGIPLELTSRLLPMTSRLSLGSQVHIHWHAAMIRKHGDTQTDRPAPKTMKLSLAALKNLITSLRDFVDSLSYHAAGTEWADYYSNNTYTDDTARKKHESISGWLDQHKPETVWDFGANTGVYSRLASQRGASVLSLDIDPACVEQNYLAGKANDEKLLTPACIDLTNPTPAIGWSHAERPSLAQRGPCDIGMALALVHHLAIANNTPLDRIASYFAETCKQLIIEWVPKSDPQVKRLLSGRKDIFDQYTIEGFEAAMQTQFDIVEQFNVEEPGGRVIYLMSRKK